MRNKTILLIVGVLALTLWLGLVGFMNRQAPVTANMVIFLLILGFAVAFSTMPIWYAANGRLARSLGRGRDLGRAARQGGMVGALATILMALRFMRVLNLTIAIILIFVVVLVETLIYLRVK